MAGILADHSCGPKDYACREAYHQLGLHPDWAISGGEGIVGLTGIGFAAVLVLNSVLACDELFNGHYGKAASHGGNSVKMIAELIGKALLIR